MWCEVLMVWWAKLPGGEEMRFGKDVLMGFGL